MRQKDPRSEGSRPWVVGQLRDLRYQRLEGCVEFQHTIARQRKDHVGEHRFTNGRGFECGWRVDWIKGSLALEPADVLVEKTAVVEHSETDPGDPMLEYEAVQEETERFELGGPVWVRARPRNRSQDQQQEWLLHIHRRYTWIAMLQRTRRITTPAPGECRAAKTVARSATWSSPYSCPEQ
jgi:hypothetical protein